MGMDLKKWAGNKVNGGPSHGNTPKFKVELVTAETEDGKRSWGLAAAQGRGMNSGPATGLPREEAEALKKSLERQGQIARIVRA